MKSYDAAAVVAAWSPVLAKHNDFEQSKLRPIFEAAAKGEAAADFFEGSLQTPAYTAAEMVRLACVSGLPMPKPLNLSLSSGQEELKRFEAALCSEDNPVYEELSAGFISRFGYDSPSFCFERLFTAKAALAALWASAALSVEAQRKAEAQSKGKAFNEHLGRAFNKDRAVQILSIVLLCLNQADVCAQLNLNDIELRNVALDFRKVYGCGGITPPLRSR